MEDYKMEMKAEASQLCKMLCKPDSQRMPFEGVQIAKSLQRIPFLYKFFDMKSQPFINLCITSSIIEFQPNSDVYQTESQRYIYIILQGTVKVTLKNAEHQIFQQSKHHLSEFGIFGQTQVLFGLQERCERITAENNSVKCMVFQQEAIKKIINPSMQKFIAKTINYLSVNEYFQVPFQLKQQLTIFQRQQLVIHLSLQTFNKGDVIVETDSHITQILFIVYGRVLVVKDLMLKLNQRKQQYKIDELSEMDSFGQFETHYENKSEYFLIAETSGAYFSLDHESLKQSNHRVLKMIKQRAIPYPDEEELGFLHDIKNSLKMVEGKIVKKNKLFN